MSRNRSSTSTLSSTWSSLTSKLRGSSKSNPTVTLGAEMTKSESKLEAEIVAQTKAARKSASRSPKKNEKKARVRTPCRTPVLERRLVVWRKCLRFDEKSAVSRVKKIWYEREEGLCDFLIKDLNEYFLREREDCVLQNPALMTAVDGWLGKRKNRKPGWRFKCTIADGVKMITDHIPNTSGTFVEYVLIERVVECKCGGGLGRYHIPVENVAIAAAEAATAY